MNQSTYPAEALQAALRLHQQGQVEAAARAYRQILASDAGVADAWHLLGVALQQLGQEDEGIASIRKAIALAPSTAVFHANLAAALRKLGRAEEALSSLRAATALNPADIASWRHLGRLLQDRGEFDQAIVCFQMAVEREPASGVNHYNLGTALQQQGNTRAAADCLRRALELQPDLPEAHSNYAVLLQGEARFEEAIEHYRQAIALDPKYFDAQYNYGIALFELSRYQEAIEVFRSAMPLKPDDPAVHCNLGVALAGDDQQEEAEIAYQETLRLDPANWQTICNLGLALTNQGRWREAIDCFDRALPAVDADWLRIRKALTLPVIPESREAVARDRQRFEAAVSELLGRPLSVDDPVRLIGVTPFFLAYQGFDDRSIQERLAQLFLHATPSLAYVAPHCQTPNARASGSKLKVGFVSKFLSDHSVGRINGGILRHLNRERMHVTLLRFPGHADAMSQAIDRSADEVVHLNPRLAVARQQVADRELDVLVYTDIGMEPWTYHLAFARLAPVQCALWGHPDTTGISTIDYFLSSVELEPPDADDHYTEKLVRLNSINAYLERPPRLPAARRAEFGLDEHARIYMCAQSLFKLHPEFDELLAQILRKDERGQVVLFEGKRPMWASLLAARFARTIPDVAARIRFLPRMAYQRYLQAIATADVLLDTIHFSGGITTFDALGIGAPIVTWPGKFMRGRQTYACYRGLGVMDCVARDASEYVELATSLAADPDRRQDIRGRIVAAQVRLFENIAPVRELEEFLLSAVS